MLTPRGQTTSKSQIFERLGLHLGQWCHPPWCLPSWFDTPSLTLVMHCNCYDCTKVTELTPNEYFTAQHAMPHTLFLYPRAMTKHQNTKSGDGGARMAPIYAHRTIPYFLHQRFLAGPIPASIRVRERLALKSGEDNDICQRTGDLACTSADIRSSETAAIDRQGYSRGNTGSRSLSIAFSCFLL